MDLLRTLALVIAVWAATTVADSNLDIPFPYNCSTRTTCSSLRLKLPQTNEEFHPVHIMNQTDSELVFHLENKRGDELKLTITAVKNQIFRVVIEEHDEHRYKLEHSLEQEPELKKFVSVTTANNTTTAVDDEGNKVIVRNAPFEIAFVKDDEEEVVFQGNRLVMQNTEEAQSFTFDVKFNNVKHLMGLHEHADYLNLRHTADFSIDPYRLRNTDYGTTEYVLNVTRSMYGSIPVLYGFGNRTSGIFHHNAAEQWIDIDLNTKSSYWIVDGGRLDIFVLLGPTLKETVRQYTSLTGRPHLPQLWALGYHQCRWAYNSTEDITTTIGNFDSYDFPLDVLWLDIEYTADRKWFTWNSTTFPDPIALLNWVDDQAHRKLVPISDPHIKIDTNYTVYNDLLSINGFVNASDGQPFVAECWPGNSSWVDYLNPAAREYYAKLHLYNNTAFPTTSTLGGYWNDMNEPALFDNLYERTFPFDNVHYGGVKHRDVHNIYGMLQTMSTHSGLIARDNGTLRPFILSRAYFAGSQRYANKWSGDNWGHFTDLRFSVPMALTSNLVGLAFYGADIPGFFGTATEELLIRWYELGIWLPFFRAHAANGSPRREPFLFGNKTQAILRDHMKLRYKHLPYWYTLFYEHTTNGDPIIRPLLYTYPEDPVGYDLSDEFLIGDSILTTSVYESNATSVPVYFPGNNEFWIQVSGNTSDAYDSGTWANISVDITFTPIFYKSGSIISRKPRALRSTAEIKDDPLELHVVLGNDNTAKTNLYIDDYESFKYVNENEYLYVELSYNSTTAEISVTNLDSNSQPGNITLNVENVILYSRDGEANKYKIEAFSVDKNGNKLTAINLLEEPIRL